MLRIWNFSIYWNDSLQVMVMVEVVQVDEDGSVAVVKVVDW